MSSICNTQPSRFQLSHHLGVRTPTLRGKGLALQFYFPSTEIHRPIPSFISVGTTDFLSGTIFLLYGTISCTVGHLTPQQPDPNCQGHALLVVETKSTPPTFPNVHSGDSVPPPTAAEDHMIICLYLFLLLGYALREGRHLTFHWSILPVPSTVPGASIVPII